MDSLYILLMSLSRIVHSWDNIAHLKLRTGLDLYEIHGKVHNIGIDSTAAKI